MNRPTTIGNVGKNFKLVWSGFLRRASRQSVRWRSLLVTLSIILFRWLHWE